MGPLKQLQQTNPGSAETNTNKPGALYNLAHQATVMDLSGSGDLPVENDDIVANAKLNMQTNTGTTPEQQVNPATGTEVDQSQLIS